MRRLVGLAATVTLVAVLVPAPPGGAAGPTGDRLVPTGDRLTWGDCPEPIPGGIPRDPRMRCAVLRVPMDYRRPHGATISVTVSRIATSLPGQRRGVLLSNPGIRAALGERKISCLGYSYGTYLGAVYALILQNLRDPATPWIAGLGLRRALGQRAAFVTQNSGGHLIYANRAGACAEAIGTAFLADGVLPARDRFCPGPSPEDVTALDAVPGWARVGPVGRPIGGAGMTVDPTYGRERSRVAGQRSPR